MSGLTDLQKHQAFNRLINEMRSNESFSNRCASIMVVEDHEVDSISYFIEEFIEENLYAKS